MKDTPCNQRYYGIECKKPCCAPKPVDMLPGSTVSYMVKSVSPAGAKDDKANEFQVQWVEESSE